MPTIRARVPLRLGLAGLGVGSALFMPGVEEHPHTQVVAAADLRRSALDAFAQRYGGRTYGSVEALCADPDIDVMVRPLIPNCCL